MDAHVVGGTLYGVLPLHGQLCSNLGLTGCVFSLSALELVMFALRFICKLFTSQQSDGKAMFCDAFAELVFPARFWEIMSVSAVGGHTQRTVLGRPDLARSALVAQTASGIVHESPDKATE